MLPESTVGLLLELPATPRTVQVDDVGGRAPAQLEFRAATVETPPPEAAEGEKREESKEFHVVDPAVVVVSVKG